jgi:glycosyltransferase involved in cell wall biosynthesis
MHVIKLNGRFYSHRPTGMQRYALELVSRIGDRLEVLRPKHALRGGLGHLWEQVYLPVATGRGLLWSPNNTGPLSVARQVCTVHDLIPLDHPEWFNPRFVALYRWLMPRLMTRLQHIVAISEFTRQRLLHLFDIDPSKITVIPNGVDKSFQPAPPDRIRQVRASLGLGDKPYVLCVSSFEPRKNLKGLLAAWAALPASIRNQFQLVLTGARGSGKVFGDAGIGEPPVGAIFTGYVAQEDLPALYSGAEIFAYPSLYEGFGLPPLEAMASGVPVLTSKTSSIPEVVADAGVLVDPADIDSIQEGLYRLMTNEQLRRELSERGLNRAQSLSWDRTADETWRILEREAAADES